jgi:hypothetical protein
LLNAAGKRPRCTARRPTRIEFVLAPARPVVLMGNPRTKSY